MRATCTVEELPKLKAYPCAPLHIPRDATWHTPPCPARFATYAPYIVSPVPLASPHTCTVAPRGRWERVFPTGTPPRAMDLARKLLCYDPAARLTATQALAHPFLQDVEQMIGHDANRHTPSSSVKALFEHLNAKSMEAIKMRDSLLNWKVGAISPDLPRSPQN